MIRFVASENSDTLTLRGDFMGDRLRDELKKKRKRGTTRGDRGNPASEARRAAIKRQQSRAAFRDAAKEKATQGVLKWQ